MFKYNEEFDFYGVCNNEFKLGDTVYEAVEDPDDGYRSYLGSIEVKNSDGIFFGMPLARVKAVAVSDHRDLDGWEFVDVTDGHVWLRVGTDCGDSYYPYFVFEYSPKRA